MLGIALQLPWLLCAQNPMQQYWILVGSSCSDLNLSSSVTLPAPYFTARNIIGTSYTATIPTGATLQLGCGNATGTTSAILAGAGGLKKIGTGAITLTSTNTYTGNTVINTGTLQVGDCTGGSLGNGSYAGAITNNGSLIVNTPVNQTLSGVISGTGSLTKLCSGTTFLTGTNTYTGTTTNGVNVSIPTITAGTNTYFTNVPSDMTVAMITLNSLVNGVTTGNFMAGGNPYALYFFTNDGTAATVQMQINDGGFLKSLKLQFTINNSVLTTTLLWAKYSNTAIGTDQSGATDQTTAGAYGVKNLSIIINTGALQIGNGGTTGSITNTNKIVNNSSLIYNTTSNLTQSQVISGTGSLTQNGTGILTLTNNSTFTGGTTVNNGILKLAKLVNNSNGTIIGTLTINANGEVDANTTNWDLGWDVNRVSTININGGKLVFNGTDNNGGMNANVNMNGGTISGSSFDWFATGANTINVLDDSNITAGMNLRSTLNTTIDINKTLSVSGVMTNSGAIVKSGAGTLLLTGDNTNTGNITINAGILKVGDCVTGKLGGGAYAGNIINNGSLIINTPATQTLSGIVSGTGSLSKLCTANAILTGANTYTGVTTIADGTLQIGNGGTTGSIANTANIVNNSALVYNTTSNLTQSQVISGTGNVTQNGTNIVTLSGANTYTGGTNINAGTIKISSDGNLGGTSGAISINGGSLAVSADNITLNANRGIVVGTNGATIDNTSIGTTGNTYIAGVISGNGPITLKSIGSLAGKPTGDYGLGIKLSNTANTFTGDITIKSGLVSYASDGSFGNVTNKIILDGGGMLDANQNIPLAHPIQINAGGGTLRTYTGANVFWSSTLTGAGTVNHTDGGTLNLTGDLTGFTGTLANLQGTLVIANPTNQIFSGNLAGTFPINKSDVGSLTLTGTNTNSGTMTINAGVLQIGNGGTTGAIPNVSGITNNSAIIYNMTSDNTQSGVITGTGSLTKLGSGTLTVPSIGYTGTTNINEGKLKISNTSNIGLRNVLMQAGGTLEFNVPSGISRNLTSYNAIAGDGTVIKSGAGTLYWGDWSGDYKLNLNSGLLDIQAGTLQDISDVNGIGQNDFANFGGSVNIATGAIFGLGNSNLQCASLTGGGTLDLRRGTGGKTVTIGFQNGGGTFSGVIASSIKIRKIGTGTQILSGANTYTGGSTIDGGTIVAGSATALGTGAVAINNGGTLSLNANITSTQTITVNAGGTLNKNGFTFAGTITNNGGTVIN